MRAGLRGPASVAHGVNCGLLQAARVLFICLFALPYFNLIIKSQSATHPQARPPSDGADFSQVMIPINFGMAALQETGGRVGGLRVEGLQGDVPAGGPGPLPSPGPTGPAVAWGPWRGHTLLGGTVAFAPLGAACWEAEASLCPSSSRAPRRPCCPLPRAVPVSPDLPSQCGPGSEPR